MTTPYSLIAEIDALIRALSEEDRRLIRSLFDIRVEAAETLPPPTMVGWTRQRFGAVSGIRSQRIVKVLNKVTLEGTLFNPVRALRPQSRQDPAESATLSEDPLADPERSTPADPFGRTKGQYAVTAANLAKADVHHAVVIFDTTDPFAFDRERIGDYLDTAWRWVRAAHRYDSEAVYPLLLWNAGARAGASLAHGHMQALLGRGQHYARVEALRRAAGVYSAGGLTGYFRDVVRAHAALGLALEQGTATVLAHLTPVKEREVIILAPALGEDFASALYGALLTYRDYLGVRSFNVVVYLPPLLPVVGWDGVPVLARLVDRGDPASGAAADVGAMELYAQSVVSADPFDVVRALTEAFTAIGHSGNGTR